ncbi:hypothetical protein FOA52_011382 [Chlamydomonas sp. UWO 241]|nr:hypothetical protein FOA52_011382 [Chlamydomonas sp. UWO 241]
MRVHLPRLQPARPAASAAALVASAAAVSAGTRPAAAGAARAASPSSRAMRAAPAGSRAPRRLQAVAAAAQQRHSFVAALSMEDATVCNQKSEKWLHNCAGNGRCERPAGGRVVSASLLDAKPAVSGIGVVPQRGGVLRVLFTVTSDVAADTVVRYRHRLRSGGRMSIFDVLSDREEARH